jgi:hypothetical protein
MCWQTLADFADLADYFSAKFIKKKHAKSA